MDLLLKNLELCATEISWSLRLLQTSYSPVSIGGEDQSLEIGRGYEGDIMDAPEFERETGAGSPCSPYASPAFNEAGSSFSSDLADMSNSVEFEQYASQTADHVMSPFVAGALGSGGSDTPFGMLEFQQDLSIGSPVSTPGTDRWQFHIGSPYRRYRLRGSKPVFEPEERDHSISPPGSYLPADPYSQADQAYQNLIPWLQEKSQSENWPESTLEGFMPVLQGSLQSTYVPGKGRRKINTQILARFLSDKPIGHEVVDFILEVVSIRYPPTPGTHILTNTIHEKSVQKKVRAILQASDILHILFPIGLDGHWVAVDADFSTRRIAVFDSLNSSGEISNPLTLKITETLNGIGHGPTSRMPWNIYFHPYPQQLDGFSCGVATICAIHHATHPDTPLWNPQTPGLTRMHYYRLCVDRTLPEVPDSMFN
ncbi:hypothetical protein EDB19DRAFT_1914432 [Suillus lakei]|nr:hypothetical protein EDB19DRAFT_1914432 [Suillus lakei]